MRVLFVAGEVAPFSETSAPAQLIRTLPEAIQDTGSFETRIMMPRYGVVSERRNRLHEVIRLSGAEIPVGTDKDTVKVKVASIPGIRLQVYFIDSVKYFKRKGLHADRKTGEVFADNAERALFYARAALQTAKRLGWGPDVVHASGWIAALLPHVLRTEWADDPLFAATRSVFTPDEVGDEAAVSAAQAEALGLPADWAGRTLNDIGRATADALVLADDGSTEPGVRFEGDKDEVAATASAFYQGLPGPRVVAA